MNRRDPRVRWAVLDRLLPALLERPLSPDEAAELGALVLTDPVARRTYVAYLQVHAHLPRSAGVLLDATGVREEGGMLRFPRGAGGRSTLAPSRRWFLAAGSLAAAVLVLATVFARLTGPDAHIVAHVDALWSDGRQVVPEPAVRTQAYALATGLVHLRFAHGAEVIIEAPARYRVSGPDALWVEKGRVWVRCVAPGSVGFEVGGDGWRVEDLSTEFGLDARGAAVDAVVMEGRVAVESLRTGRREVLEAGETMHVAADGGMRPRGEPVGVVGVDRFALLADESLRRRAWTERSALLVWESFEWGGVLHDPPVGVAGVTLSGGVVTTGGRRPGARAVRFGAGDGEAVLSVPGRYGALTFAAWVNFGTEPAASPRRHRALLVPRRWGTPGHPLWEVYGEQLRLAMPAPEHPRGKIDVTASVPDLFDSRWHLLTTTLDLRSGSVRHYANGQLVVEQVLPGLPDSVGLGASTVGDEAAERRAPDDPRHFGGAVDELMIWARALTRDEVGALYMQELHHAVRDGR